ncbi:MAG: hypothetical protein N2047_03870 [Meiothermus sp.]|nr:hypothetical protein [Meiothermus sp.]
MMEKWLARRPATTWEYTQVVAKALLQGFITLEEVEREVLYRTSLQILSPLLLAGSKGDGERFLELLQEAAVRLPEELFGPVWGPQLRGALSRGVSPAAVVRLWGKTWLPSQAEALAWGAPVEEVRRLRALRHQADRGNPRAKAEAEEALLRLSSLSLDWEDEDGDRAVDLPDPRWEGVLYG